VSETTADLQASSLRAPLSGLLFVLLGASILLWFVVPPVVHWFDSALRAVIDPTLVGSLLYTVLGVITLLYWITRRRVGFRDHDRFELLYLGGVLAMLSLPGFFLLIARGALPAVPTSLLVTLLAGPVGMGAMALAYARTRQFDLQVALPSNDSVGYLLGAAFLAAAIGVASVGVWAVLEFDRPFTTQRSLSTLVQVLLIPSVLTGLGWGLLYNGAI